MRASSRLGAIAIAAALLASAMPAQAGPTLDRIRAEGRIDLGYRDDAVPFSFREEVHELSDLAPGMVCPGIVTNVTNFGAFVDVGVHQDGLVHISQLSSTRFVKDPREVVNPGDRVQVKVLSVDLARQRISLTMRLGEPAGAPAPRSGPPPPAGRPQPRPEPPKPQVDRRWAALADLKK